MMRNRFCAFMLILVVFATLSSCLKDNDDDVVYYDDTAITSFSLGTLARTVHTISTKGEDSIYTASVVGSAYKFYIDQQKGLIYNVDSLPLNTNIKKVVTAVTAKNGGTILVNYRTKDAKDSLVYYSNADSLDFTNPLEFRVYNVAGTVYRKYVISVNAHQEDGDAFNWKRMEEPFSAMADLLAAREIMVGKASWTHDPLDTSADWLPTEDVNLVEMPLRTNAGMRRVLIGNRSAADYAGDATAVVWSRIVESDEAAEVQPWLYYTPSSNNRYLLPRMKDLQVVAYVDALLAIGGSGVGTCTAEPYTAFYESKDGGITWHESETYKFPDGFNTGKKYVMVVDDNQYLWLVSDDGAQVWRARLNRLAWEHQ